MTQRIHPPAKPVQAAQPTGHGTHHSHISRSNLSDSQNAHPLIRNQLIATTSLSTNNRNNDELLDTDHPKVGLIQLCTISATTNRSSRGTRYQPSLHSRLISRPFLPNAGFSLCIDQHRTSRHTKLLIKLRHNDTSYRLIKRFQTYLENSDIDDYKICK